MFYLTVSLSISQISSSWCTYLPPEVPISHHSSTYRCLARCFFFYSQCAVISSRIRRLNRRVSLSPNLSKLSLDCIQNLCSDVLSNTVCSTNSRRGVMWGGMLSRFTEPLHRVGTTIKPLDLTCCTLNILLPSLKAPLWWDVCVCVSVC